MRGSPLRTGTVFSQRGRPMILGMCNPSKVKLLGFREELLPLHMYTCLSRSPVVSVVPANRDLFGMHELQDDEGNPTDWAFVDPELLYGPNGWCEADEPAHRCTCLIDGVAGPTCDEPTGASKFWCKPNRCWPDTPPGLIMTLVFCEIESGQLCIPVFSKAMSAQRWSVPTSAAGVESAGLGSADAMMDGEQSGTSDAL